MGRTSRCVGRSLITLSSEIFNAMQIVNLTRKLSFGMTPYGIWHHLPSYGKQRRQVLDTLMEHANSLFRATYPPKKSHRKLYAYQKKRYSSYRRTGLVGKDSKNKI